MQVIRDCKGSFPLGEIFRSNRNLYCSNSKDFCLVPVSACKTKENLDSIEEFRLLENRFNIQLLSRDLFSLAWRYRAGSI